VRELLVGDNRKTLATLPDGVAQTCVTSPPYWGLRDYGHDDQIGLEQTPDEYVAQLVEVFREVRRVLADDGTMWLNLGDSYAGTGKGPSNVGHGRRNGQRLDGAPAEWIPIPKGLKPKDLVGIPWRVAFALQADGWYLRSDIIWHKPNPMPESVTDRPTSAHEHVFLLSKSKLYFYDADAIREAHEHPELARNFDRADANAGRRGDYQKESGRNDGGSHVSGVGFRSDPDKGRNARNVWTITSKPYKGAHFATMPPDLAKRCILAGSRVGDTVLDPFLGSGTTAQCAETLGREWVGCELQPNYEELIRERTAQRGLGL
jgi:DNA modification methylase